MGSKNKRLKVFTMLLSSLISNCLCFSSKEYKDYDKNKINRVNCYKKKKKKFNAQRSQKSNLLRNMIVTAGVSFLGIGSVCLGKKCFSKNKTVENGNVFRIDEKNIKEREVNGVKLSVSDQIWIAKNMILFEWKYPLCWHNAFMQFLACPDVRQFAYLSDKSQSRYKSNKIMTMINWINKELSKPYYGDYLERCVGVPMGIRRAQDGAEKHLGSSEGYLVNFVAEVFDGYTPEFLGDYKIFFDFDKDEELYTGLEEIKYEDAKNFFLMTQMNLRRPNQSDYNEQGECIREFRNLQPGDRNEKFFAEDWLKQISESGYYPTFFQIDCERYSVPHLCACYAVYNKDKEIKYFLWANSHKCEKFVVLSKEEGLKKLRAQNQLWINFARGDIVEKYFTP